MENLNIRDMVLFYLQNLKSIRNDDIIQKKKYKKILFRVISRFVSEDVINKKLKKSILTHSRPSKIMLLLGVLSVFLSLINRVSAPLILIEIFYLTLAMTTNCMVYGTCRVAAYLSIALPTFFIFVNILSFLDVEIPVPDFFKKDNLIPDEKYLFKNEGEKQ